MPASTSLHSCEINGPSSNHITKLLASLCWSWAIVKARIASSQNVLKCCVHETVAIQPSWHPCHAGAVRLEARVQARHMYSCAGDLESPLMRCNTSKIGNTYPQYLQISEWPLPKQTSAHYTIARDFHKACAWHPSKGKRPPCPMPPSSSSYLEQIGFMLSARASGLRFGNMFCAAFGPQGNDQASVCRDRGLVKVMHLG